MLSKLLKLKNQPVNFKASRTECSCSECQAVIHTGIPDGRDCQITPWGEKNPKQVKSNLQQVESLCVTSPRDWWDERTGCG